MGRVLVTGRLLGRDLLLGGFSRGGGSSWGSAWARGPGAGGEEKEDLMKAMPCKE
jgi:hypothetical protein